MNKEKRKRCLLEVNLNTNNDIPLNEEPLKKINKTNDIDANSSQIVVNRIVLKNEIVPREVNHDDKCPSCKYTFLDPRLLPCEDVICFICINFIRDENNNDEYECPVCHEIHSYLDQENLPQVKVKQPIESDLKKENKNDPQLEQHMNELKNLFQDIQAKMDDFARLLAHPEIEIKRHCDSLKLEVDLATEKVVGRARSIHDEFFSRIDEYESKCLTNLSNNLETYKQKKLEYESLSIKLNIIEEQSNIEHLKKAKLRLIDIRREISKSKLNLEKVDSNFKILNSFLFDAKKMQYLPDAEIDTQHLLGKFWFEPIYNEVKKVFKNKNNILFDLPKNDKIHQVEYLPKSTSYAVLTTNNEQVFVNLIDGCKSGFLLKRVTFLQSKNIKERHSAFHSSANSESKIVFSIQARNSPKQEFDSYYFFLFDENLNLLASQEMTNSDFTSIVSICLNESSHTYTLWQSAEKRSYLTVYDDKLNYLNTLGVFSNRISDPFYLPSNLESIKSSHGKLLLLGSKRVKILNEKTGLVELVYEMESVKLIWTYQNSYLITCDGKRSFFFFDLNMRSRLGYVSLNKQALHFKYKHVSNEKLILFNEDSNEIYSFD